MEEAYVHCPLFSEFRFVPTCVEGLGLRASALLIGTFYCNELGLGEFWCCL